MISFAMLPHVGWDTAPIDSRRVEQSASASRDAQIIDVFCQMCHDQKLDFANKFRDGHQCMNEDLIYR